MALTRKFLTALGIEAEKAEEIINAHAETVNGVKADLETAKADAEKLSETQKELEKVQKELDEFKAKADDGYKDKYDSIKKEFEEYKKSVSDKEVKDKKTKAYKDLLQEANISEKRFDAIVKLSSDAIDKLELEEDGNVKDKSKVLKAISEDWSEFVKTTETQGAKTATPPANNGGDSKKISRAAQIAQQYHDDLYGKLKEG